MPGDGQRKQQAPQFSVDAVLKDMLVGVVVWKGNTSCLEQNLKHRSGGFHSLAFHCGQTVISSSDSLSVLSL